MELDQWMNVATMAEFGCCPLGKRNHSSMLAMLLHEQLLSSVVDAKCSNYAILQIVEYLVNFLKFIWNYYQYSNLESINKLNITNKTKRNENLCLPLTESWMTVLLLLLFVVQLLLLVVAFFERLGVAPSVLLEPLLPFGLRFRVWEKTKNKDIQYMSSLLENFRRFLYTKLTQDAVKRFSNQKVS